MIYTKSDSSPLLFAKPLTGGPEHQVPPLVYAGAFVPVEDGIYFISPPGEDKKFPLQFYQFSSNTTRLLTKLEGYLWIGLSVSPDRRTILFAKSLTKGQSLMMIENFQ